MKFKIILALLAFLFIILWFTRNVEVDTWDCTIHWYDSNGEPISVCPNESGINN